MTDVSQGIVPMDPELRVFREMNGRLMIRHGITEGNQKRLYYGSSDIPLAEEGIEMLRNLSAQEIYPDDTDAKYYTSGMLRTEQTFSLIYRNAAASRR